MTYVWSGLMLLAGTFLYISLRGAPYVPTLKREVKRALDVAGLQPGMTVVDLGAGDGRLLLAAAHRGCHAIGYELNPLLVMYARCRSYAARQQVQVRLCDFWHTPLPGSTDVVFVFLAQPFMAKLERHMVKECRRMNKRLVLVSFGFTLPGRQPSRRDGAVYRYDFQPDTLQA